MIRPNTLSNTYEESPEALQDLLKNGKDETGRKPPTRTSRGALLKSHEVHLQLLASGSLPVKNMILPLPYPPSRIKMNDERCKKIYLDDLKIQERDLCTAIYLRTITPPYVHSACTTIVEDIAGNVARLTVCNLEDSIVDPILVEGSIIGIKQPCWSRLVDGGYEVRVDHPSDMVILEGESEEIPDEWRDEKKTPGPEDEDSVFWKKEGDRMFLTKKFRRALDCYNYGLAYLASHPNPAAEVDLHRKKCGVHIVLLRLDAAAHDLSLAISIHAQSTSELSSHPMASTSTVKSWLHNRSTVDPHDIAPSLPKALKDLAARIKFDLGIYTETPNYNLPLISSYVGPLTLHVDAATYTCNTEIRNTASHGHGLFAKKAFEVGELIAAEKAFVLPGYFIQDRSSDCLLYSLGDGTAAPRPGALLFKELVQKLRWNGSLRKEYFGLADGGYWKEHGWEEDEEEDENAEGEGIVDVFRIEFIRRFNCFSVPTTSASLLHAPPTTISNPELRNGFWIHAAYVNHSCLPNAIRTFIGDMHFLRAARPIAAGEEITHQYISPDYDIKERQEKYSATWGFECDCKICTLDGEIGDAIRTERMTLFEDLKAKVGKLGESGATTVTAIKKIARGLRELEVLYDEDSYATLPRLALVHPTLFLTEAWRGVKNLEKTIEYALKLLRNFGIITSTEGGRFEVKSCSGLINVEGVRALKYLTEAWELKGEAVLKEDCLAIARTWYAIITGADVGVDEFLKY